MEIEKCWLLSLPVFILCFEPQCRLQHQYIASTHTNSWKAWSMLFHRPCYLIRIKVLFYGYNLLQLFTLTYCHTLKVSKDAFLFNFKVTIVNSTLESKFVLLTIIRLISSIRYYIIMYYQIYSCPLIYWHIHWIVSVFCTFNSAYTYITYSRVLLMGLYCLKWYIMKKSTG